VFTEYVAVPPLKVLLSVASFVPRVPFRYHANWGNEPETVAVKIPLLGPFLKKYTTNVSVLSGGQHPPQERQSDVMTRLLIGSETRRRGERGKNWLERKQEQCQHQGSFVFN